MDFIINAFSSSAGAFTGAMAAYAWSCHLENKRTDAEYAALLLIVYEHLETVYNIFIDVPTDFVRKIDGEKVVVFSSYFPNLGITDAQFYKLMEVAPDKQMPAALIKFDKLLKTYALKASNSGVMIIPSADVEIYVRQLKFMLLSILTQYEQQTNDAFPLNEYGKRQMPQ